MKSLFIVNQSPIFLLGLEHLFSTSSTFTTVFSAANTCQFWTAIHQQIPDVILLDSHFADLCPVLKQQQGAAVKILLFGTPLDAKRMKQLFCAGATGFTLQTVEPQLLTEAVERVANGELYVHPDLLSAYLNSKSCPQHALHVLTKREQEILNLIVDEKTTQEIATQLFISLATVETHRHHLINKFGVKNTAGLVREAMRAAV